MGLQDIKINVDASLFARATACVSKEETRYYLNGVSVEALPSGGVMMASTDGHQLVVIRDPSGSIEGGCAIVSANRAVLACCEERSKRRRDAEFGPRRLLVSSGKLSIVAVPKKDKPLLDFTVCETPGDTVLAFQWRDVLIDGTFPDWRRALPKSDPITSPARTGFRSVSLENLRKALAATGSTGAADCRGDPSDGSPIWVFFPDSQRFVDGFGIIMPVRIEPIVRPSWAIKQVPVDKAPEAKAV